jgi:tetratricopeptide (TPR) repeat protein
MPNRKVISQTLDLELTHQQVENLKRHYAGVVKHLENRLPLNHSVLENLKVELTGIVNLLPEWKKVLNDIYNSGDYYRLLLRHRDNEILNLPWSMAVDKNSGKSLGAIRQLYLCKGIHNYFSEETNFTTTAAPLKVLVMISAPEDLGISGQFFYEVEEFAILQAFSPLMESGQVEIDFTENGSLESLEKKLIECKYHILHFSGHGIYKKRNNQGYLLLEDAMNMKRHLVEDRDFADTVNGNPDYLVPMVLLSSCQTAVGGSEETLRGVTNHLLRIGVPVVVSMGMSILDKYAAYFSAYLYAEMARKQSVFAAFNRAVEAIRKKEYEDIASKKKSPSEPLQWIIPNLYLSQPVERVVDWTAPEKKMVWMSNRYIFEKDRLLLPHNKEYIFIDRRREKAGILSPLFQKTPILIKGQGGVGKTAMAEHLVHRLIAYNPKTVPFAFNEKLKSIEDILDRLKDYLRDLGQVEVITKLVNHEKGLDKFIFLAFQVKNNHEPVFIFDNLEIFQQGPGEEFCDQFMDLKEIIAYLCRCQQFHVILTSRYPVPSLENLQSLDLNQFGFTDFWKKCLYMQMGGIHTYLHEEEEKLRKAGQLSRGVLSFLAIVRLLHGTFGGNFRALEFFHCLVRENPQKIREALGSLEAFREQSAEMVGAVREQMGQNLLFSRLMALLDRKQQEVLALLSGFRVPVALMALEAQLKGQGQEIKKIDFELADLKTMLDQMQRLTLIEVSIDRELDEVFYYVTPIVRDMLDVYEKDAAVFGLVFSHQKAGDYYYHCYQKLKGGVTVLEEAFYHYDQAGTDPDRLQEVGDRLSSFYYKIFIVHKVFFYAHRVYEVFGDGTHGRILNYLGLTYGLYGDYKKALAIFKKALAAYRKEKDKEGEGATLNNFYQIYDVRGDYETALKYLRQSLKISQQIGNKKGEGAVLNNLGEIYRKQYDYNMSLKYLEQALEIRKQIGDKEGEGATLNNLSMLYRDRGDYETALKYIEQSLKIFQQIGDKRGEGTILNNISQLYAMRSEYDMVLKYLELGLKILQQIGDRIGEGTTLNNIGDFHIERGDHDTALKYLEQSLKVFQYIGYKAGESASMNNFSKIYTARGDYDTSLKYLEQSLKIHQQIVDKKGEASTLNRMGTTVYVKGDFDMALKYFGQSLNIYQQIDDKEGKSVTLSNISLVYQVGGDYENALKYMEQSLKMHQQINDQDGSITALALHGMALIELEKENLQKYIEYETSAYTIAIRHNDARSIFNIGANLGYVLCHRGKKQKGLEVLKKSLQIGITTGFPDVSSIEETLKQFTGERGTLYILSEIYKKQGNYDLALNYLEQILEVSRYEGDKKGEWATLNDIGKILETKGDYNTAFKYMEQGLEISRQLGEVESAISLKNIGSEYDKVGDYPQAVNYYEQAISAFITVYGKNHHEVGLTLFKQGLLWKKLEEHGKAKSNFKQSLVILKKVIGENHLMVAIILNYLGECWHALGKIKKSLKFFKKSLEIFINKPDEDNHTFITLVLINLGNSWSDLSEYKKAMDYYRQVLEIDRSVYGQEHPNTARDLIILGYTWSDLGEYNKAINHYRQSLDILRKVYGDKHPDVARVLFDLGMDFKNLKNYHESIDYFEQALSIELELYGEEHPDVARDFNNLGSVCFQIGEQGQAKDYFKKAYDILYKSLGQEHPETKAVCEWLNKCQ